MEHHDEHEAHDPAPGAEPPAGVTGRFAEGWYGGVECASGWYGILERLDAELSAADPGYKVLQVKEKFGGLRYYYEPSETADEQALATMRDAVARAEAAAWRTCEETGRPGVLMRRGGWLRVLDPASAGEGWEVVNVDPV